MKEDLKNRKENQFGWVGLTSTYIVTRMLVLYGSRLKGVKYTRGHPVASKLLSSLEIKRLNAPTQMLVL